MDSVKTAFNPYFTKCIIHLVVAVSMSGLNYRPQRHNNIDTVVD